MCTWIKLNHICDSDFVYSLRDAIINGDYEFVSICMDNLDVPVYNVMRIMIPFNNDQSSYDIKFNFWKWFLHSYEITVTDEATNLNSIILRAISYNDIETLLIFHKSNVKLSSSLYAYLKDHKKKPTFLFFQQTLKIPLPEDVSTKINPKYQSII